MIHKLAPGAPVFSLAEFIHELFSELESHPALIWPNYSISPTQISLKQPGISLPQLPFGVFGRVRSRANLTSFDGAKSVGFYWAAMSMIS